MSEPLNDTDAIAAWAMNSYPERGDGAFILRASPLLGEGGASVFFSGLVAYTINRMFIRDIQSVLSSIEDTGCITIAQQEEANRIWEAHASEFLRSMYALHDDGAVRYREQPDFHESLDAWVREHRVTQEDT